jgi:hypothetical protein
MGWVRIIEGGEMTTVTGSIISGVFLLILLAIWWKLGGLGKK